MKILYFSKNSSSTFMKSLFLCNCLEVQTVRLCYILLHATILGVAFKGLVSVSSQLSSVLVGKAYLRKTDACNCNKKMINIIFNFLKSNSVLKILFALIPVNKDLGYKFTSEEERSIVWYNFLWNKFVVFGSNSLNMSASFDKNFQKSIALQYCLLVTLKVSIFAFMYLYC